MATGDDSWGVYNAGAIISLFLVVLQMARSLPPNEKRMLTVRLRDEVRRSKNLDPEDFPGGATQKEGLLFVFDNMLSQIAETESDARLGPSSTTLWEEWEGRVLGGK